MKILPALFALCICVLHSVCVLPISAQYNSQNNSQNGAAQSKLSGYWAGKLSIGKMASYNTYLEFRLQGDSLRGWLDIPAQGVNGLKISDIRLRDSVLTFNIQASPGSRMRFTTHLGANAINGSAMQAGLRMELSATRTDSNTSPANKPLTKRRDSLYTEEEVRIQVSEDVLLAGSLVLPDTALKNAAPCVIFLSGTGQQDRDETIYGFHGFKVLAEALAKKGIASLRCDDRCIGGSRGDLFSFTTRDLANDAAACVEWLKKRKEIKPTSIAILGHSEGGIIAGMLAAEREDIAAIVLFGSSAVKGDTIIKSQIRDLMSAEGKTAKEIDSALAKQDEAYKMIRTGEGFAAYEQTIRNDVMKEFAAMPAPRKKMIEDTTDAIESMINSRLAQVKMPWFRYFIDYDPANDLRKIHVPVLALFGEKDMQVPPALNKPVMDAMLESQAGVRDVRIVVIESANHLFQAAKTGLVKEYPELKKEYAPGVVETISDWCAMKLMK